MQYKEKTGRYKPAFKLKSIILSFIFAIKPSGNGVSGAFSLHASIVQTDSPGVKLLNNSTHINTSFISVTAEDLQQSVLTYKKP